MVSSNIAFLKLEISSKKQESFRDHADGARFAHSKLSIRDLEGTLSTLKHIFGSTENISPEYESKVAMASLTTLVDENLFAKMSLVMACL